MWKLRAPWEPYYQLVVRHKPPYVYFSSFSHQPASAQTIPAPSCRNTYQLKSTHGIEYYVFLTSHCWAHTGWNTMSFWSHIAEHTQDGILCPSDLTQLSTHGMEYYVLLTSHCWVVQMIPGVIPKLTKRLTFPQVPCIIPSALDERPSDVFLFW